MRVAVTGHRPGPHLPDSAVTRVAREVDAVVALLSASDSDSTEKADPAILVSSLAEGADRIAARAALAAHWRLHVVLPLASGEFEADFRTPASLREFRELLSAASWVDIVELAPGAERVDAYAAAGARSLDESRLLLAIWDGRPARGRGGTGEVVEEALRRRMLVVHVDAAGVMPTRLIGLDSEMPFSALSGLVASARSGVPR